MSFSEDDILPPGVYERLVDRLLEKQLKRLEVAGLKPQKTAVDPADLPFLLSRYLEKWLLSEFRALSGESQEALRITFANQILSR